MKSLAILIMSSKAHHLIWVIVPQSSCSRFHYHIAYYVSSTTWASILKIRWYFHPYLVIKSIGIMYETIRSSGQNQFFSILLAAISCWTIKFSARNCGRNSLIISITLAESRKALCIMSLSTDSSTFID